ncbi:DUF5050 domain-containing protein [Clostridium omnivorum]|uniref:Prolow-density lipoprotein receptor-related protein 1-like beta-propeller domain-containing protein n=1 Tax=Clostridium omnivorum TaxID=1604902 RepID=A0ABQ5N755_9CLOT|nr:DUF5050 domain-containing protein [Clostridium sp. E14]GLC31058.1 hypothetical protein bsdE14_24680 [Clostridium sp. E14]
MNKKRIIGLLICAVIIVPFAVRNYNTKSKNASVNNTDVANSKNTENKNGNATSSSKAAESTTNSNSTGNGTDNKSADNKSSKDAKKDLTLINTTPNIQGNTNGNLSNYGMAAQQGNWMFYTNEFRNSPSNIYRAMPDGETGLKKLKLGVPSSINVVNDTIYFVSKTDNNIYKLKVDGSEDPVPIPNATASSICVVGDWIYYTECNPNFNMNTSVIGGINRIKTDGSNKAIIAPGPVQMLNIEEGFIYYLKADQGSGTIYRTSIETPNNNETKLSNSNVSKFIVDNHCIYFTISEDGLYKMNTDGSNKTKVINDGSILSFNIKDNLIYYTSPKEPSVIKKISTDGSKASNIAISALQDLQISFIVNLNIIDDYIFFNFSSGSNPEFARVKLDGTTSKIIK